MLKRIFILLPVIAIQGWVSFVGLDYHLGAWAFGVALCIAFWGFPLPLAIGAFLGALNVWHWPWYGALAIALPGIFPGWVCAPFWVMWLKLRARTP